MIPEGLPFTTFLKEGEKLRKIHDDFYKQPSDNVGRPLDGATLAKRAKIKKLKKQGKSDKEIAMELERPKLESKDDIQTFAKELQRATDRIRKQRYKTKTKMS